MLPRDHLTGVALKRMVLCYLNRSSGLRECMVLTSVNAAWLCTAGQVEDGSGAGSPASSSLVRARQASELIRRPSVATLAPEPTVFWIPSQLRDDDGSVEWTPKRAEHCVRDWVSGLRIRWLVRTHARQLLRANRSLTSMTAPPVATPGDATGITKSVRFLRLRILTLLSRRLWTRE